MERLKDESVELEVEGSIRTIIKQMSVVKLDTVLTYTLENEVMKILLMLNPTK